MKKIYIKIGNKKKLKLRLIREKSKPYNSKIYELTINYKLN